MSSCICGHPKDEHYSSGECCRFYPEMKESGKVILHHCDKFRTNLEYLEEKYYETNIHS